MSIRAATPYFMDVNDSIDIDTLDDLVRAEHLYGRLKVHS